MLFSNGLRQSKQSVIILITNEERVYKWLSVILIVLMQYHRQ